MTDIIDYPKGEITRVRRQQKRRKYRARTRKKFNREELISFVLEKEITSIRKLMKQVDFCRPILQDFKDEFGSWKKAKEEIYGIKVEKVMRPDYDRRYLMKTIAYYDIWSRKKWRQAHKENPEVVPSEFHVVKHFDTFKNMFFVAERYIKMGECYWNLWIELGKKPKMTDCERHQIDISKLIQEHGSKELLDKFYSRLIEVRSDK
tara:strand:- start:5768 stop:6382 length:615 start_codon:yes stop_codon:yes gene_type:complete